MSLGMNFMFILMANCTPLSDSVLTALYLCSMTLATVRSRDLNLVLFVDGGILKFAVIESRLKSYNSYKTPSSNSSLIVAPQKIYSSALM